MWLGGSLLVAWLASANLKTAEQLVNRAGPAARLDSKGLATNPRALLRYQAAEENRANQRRWETAQLILGCAFFGLMLFGSQESKFLLGGVLLLLIIVAIEHLLVTPAVTAQGRLLDFARGAAPGEYNRYWILEKSYMAIEGTKWLLTVVLAGRIVFSQKGSGRSRDSRRKLDLVNKPDYGRVNW
jgi:hypothetical protein